MALDQVTCGFFALGFSRLHLRGLGFLCGAGEVQFEQAGKDFIFAHVSGPAVGGGDGGIERLMREGEPCGAFVVEVREGAIFEVRGAIGVARFKARIAHGADTGFLVHGFCVNVARPRAGDGAGKFERARFRPFGRIEPAFALFVQVLRGGGNRGAMFCRRQIPWR